MSAFTDQLNRQIEIVSPPKRIVSFVPSQTELLFDLGLREEVVGITKFCVHPKEWHQTKTRIGGTKTLNIEMIKSLRPDLIVANKEENVRGQVEELAKNFPVWVSDVNNLQDGYEMMQSIGALIGKTNEATDLVTNIKTAFSQLQTSNSKPKTAYLIWKDPYMTVGGDTFINDVMNKAGFENIFADSQRYPVVTVDDLLLADCELLLLSSEPYPFKQKHIDELQEALPATKIFLADGEMFSWYGSRLLHAPAYLKDLQSRIAAAT